MLEIFSSSDLILKATVVLLGIGYTSLFLRYPPWGWQAPLRLFFAAPAMELVCGVLALLFSSHYLLFVWGSRFENALPGALLGLLLVYSGSYGVLVTAKPRERPLTSALLLGGMLSLLFIGDEQRIWAASLYRLQAVVMGYPDLVLEEPGDLENFAPRPGTRVIFQPNKYEIGCGLFTDSIAPRPQLPYSISCDDYFWGHAMAAIDPELTELPALVYLARLWRDEGDGHLSISPYESYLSRNAVIDLQRLCTLTEQCAESKHVLVGLFGQSDWASTLVWLDGPGLNAEIGLGYLSSEARETLLMALDHDVREQLDKRVEVLLAAYAEAQASSLALRDMKPKSNFWGDRFPPFPTMENSAGQWQQMKTTLSQLKLQEPKLGQHSVLMPGVVLGLEPRVQGGFRLIYHTAVGRQSVEALLLFLLPLTLLCAIFFVLIWRCIRPMHTQ